MMPVAVKLLAFVAVYMVFDGANILFSAALKGAGDTRFVMVVAVSLSWIVMVLPTYLTVRYRWGPQGGLYAAWFFTTAFVCIVSWVFLGRFLRGKWKRMRVIETAPPVVPSDLPDVPIVESEA